MLLKRKKYDEQIEEVDDVQSTDTSTLSKKKNVFGTKTDEGETNFIRNMLNMLLLKNLIS